MSFVTSNVVPVQEKFRSLGAPTLAVSSLRSALPGSCTNNCNGNGDCVDGICQCHAGFTGETCKQFCPDDCSGHGDCVVGACLCLAGWQGASCDTQGCCNGHGTCETDPDTCVCDAGWSGSECTTKLVCEDRTCSGHGFCTHGTCVCVTGYSGTSCETAATVVSLVSARSHAGDRLPKLQEAPPAPLVFPAGDRVKAPVLPAPAKVAPPTAEPRLFPAKAVHQELPVVVLAQ